MKNISQITKDGSLTLVRNNKGFTLIELAVVLVIIGLILGSVIKGKDLITSAKQKNFYTSFIKSWELAIATYYDRTGYLLGDGTINGGTAASPNGIFDNVIGTNFAAADGIEATLKKVGLEVPATNTGVSGTMAYTGSNGSQTVTMYLYNLASATDGGSSNRLYFVNMPTDLAIALDRIVDGQANSSEGAFRRYADNLDGGVWPDVSTTTIVNASYLINFP
jgi:prepilin-type N-terminal cleavage/methylation domain-containing protein